MARTDNALLERRALRHAAILAKLGKYSGIVHLWGLVDSE
jgi:hypothetical protein